MNSSDKNRDFARQIGVAAEVFAAPRVAVELPPGQEQRPDAVAAFLLAGNLLCRMFHRVTLVAPDVPLGPNPWRLQRLRDAEEALAGMAAGELRWGACEEADISLSVGAKGTLSAGRTAIVTFDGWNAALDVVLSESRPGPFGALFAACYGAAQVFLHASQLAGSARPLIAPFSLSLLTYAEGGRYLPLPAAIDLGSAHLVGAGAVGSAMVYALGHLTSLRGRLHLIDNDRVDQSNLNRYVLMRQRDIGSYKTEAAARALGGTGLEAVSYPVSYAGLCEKGGVHPELLITPVDSEFGRRDLATTLPRAVLNAATGLSTVTVSRHGFADGRACLHCLYLPAREEVTTERRLAMDLGVALDVVENHLRTNRPVSPEIVATVERHRSLAPGTLAEWAGKHLQSLYQRAVCGEAHVTSAAGTVVAPLSFISAAAGVVLAAELVKGRITELSADVLDNYFRFDTLAAPNPEFKQRRRPDPSGRCVCHDSDYIEVYRERYLGKSEALAEARPA